MKIYNKDKVLYLLISFIDSYDNFIKMILYGKDTITL